MQIIMKESVKNLRFYCWRIDNELLGYFIAHRSELLGGLIRALIRTEMDALTAH